MNKQVAVVLLALVMLIPIQPIASASTEPSAQEWGVLINLSGRQRMLTQKMAKTVAMLALNYEVEKTSQELKQAHDLFDKTLDGLINGDAEQGLVGVENKRIQRQLDKVDKLWQPFSNSVKSILASASSAAAAPQDKVEYVMSNNMALLKQMNRAVRQYESASAKGEAKGNKDLALTINLAGKQRMLTQKMTKEYFMIALGYDPDTNKSGLANTYKLFKRILIGLEKGDNALRLVPTNIAEADQQLNTVAVLWSKLEPKFAAAANGEQQTKSDFDFIAVKNLELLKEMNKAVKIYERSL